ncbi:MAG: hypothetical protein ACRD72_15940, partial [Candidatus Angelobacter sp.]
AVWTEQAESSATSCELCMRAKENLHQTNPILMQGVSWIRSYAKWLVGKHFFHCQRTLSITASCALSH